MSLGIHTQCRNVRYFVSKISAEAVSEICITGSTDNMRIAR